MRDCLPVTNALRRRTFLRSWCPCGHARRNPAARAYALNLIAQRWAAS